MSRRLRLFALIFFISIAGLIGYMPPNHIAAASMSMTVGASSLNVRSAPSTSSRVIGHLNKGTHVTAYSSKYGWTHIKSGHLSGWVSGIYLIKSNTTSPSSQKGAVTVNGLRLRSTASLNGRIVTTLSKGTPVVIKANRRGWYRVTTNRGYKGWVSASYVSTKSASKKVAAQAKGWITVLYNGVNLRTGPSTSNMVIGTASKGETYQSIESNQNWVHILLPHHGSAWVAGWLVGKGKQNNPAPSSHGSLSGKTIVIDPGHGGYDVGAIGITGMFEKNATLSAASILASDLREAGANVIMTRSTDIFLSLQQRVNISTANSADAFISLHYNSSIPSAVGTMTFYYSKSKDLTLANSVQHRLIQSTGAVNDGVRFGDFHVLRENPDHSILVELGFITNYNEELWVTSQGFQQQAAQGIVNGLKDYFQ